MANNNTLAIIAASTMMLFSCSSNNNNNNVGLMKVNGVHDIVVGNVYGDSMSLNIDGLEENVTLAVTGLPQGVLTSINPASGIPEFTSFLRFTNMSAVPGTYDCQLVCSGTESGKKTYDFTAVVKGPLVCGLLTPYSGTSNCNANFSESISAVVTQESAINDIRFQNFGGRGFPVTATANCNNMTIIVPLQSINSTTSISGEGTFTTTGTVQINYIITVNNVSTSCWFALQR